MLSNSTVIIIICVYIGLLWCLALWTERFVEAGRSLVNNPVVYSLSLAVYCSSWTFFGSVGQATTSGMLFLSIYLGPCLVVIFWGGLLRKMVQLKTTYRITSIADFISARYEKSEPLAIMVTIVAMVGTVPYVALQLKAVLSAFAIVTAGQTRSDDWITMHVGFIVVGLMIIFTIIFGVRRLEPAERHEGMVMAVAAESVVKLVSSVAAGIFVVYFIYNGIDDIFGRLAADSELFNQTCEVTGNISPLTWISYLLLSANAIICLPRQFHIAVVENKSENHIKWALWMFPLYLFILTLFIYPTALAGILNGYPFSQADTYLLRLPLDKGNPLLAILVFIGGFSAATSMIMICSMTMATMISNHLLLPLADSIPRLDFIARRLLEARWITVAAFIVSGYIFERFVGHHFLLADIGILSFGAVLQLAPALFGGLFWRGGTKTGAYWGIGLGFLAWCYTMLVPAFVKSGLIDSALLKTGPLGLTLLRPQELFGLGGLDPVAHSVFISLSLNSLAYICGSLLYSPSQESISWTEAFAGSPKDFSMLYSARHGAPTVSMKEKYLITRDLFTKYFGPEKADEMAGKVFNSAGLKKRDMASIAELAELYETVEKMLGGSIGAATASRALEKAEFFSDVETVQLREMYANILTDLRANPHELKKKIDFYQEREALIHRHAEELQEKIVALEDQMLKRREVEAKLRESEERYRLAIEGSSDGVVIIRDLKIIWGNKRLPEIFGYTALEEILGRDLSAIVHPDDRSRVFAISRGRQMGKDVPSRYDFKGLKKDGSHIYIAVSATTIVFHSQTLNMAYLRDVTSRRMAEEEIHHLSRRLIDGIEEERRRLASDLHDEFGQALTALHMGVEATRNLLGPDQDELKKHCGRSIAIIEQLAENVRNISTELRPDMLDHLGLIPTVEWYINDMKSRVSGIDFEFLVTGFQNRKLEAQVEIVLYRILQEALNNVLKHAQARRVSIKLAYSHPQVILVIHDDGQGFAQVPPTPEEVVFRTGIGLVSMKERVAAVGGNIEIRSAPGKGTVIRVTLPSTVPAATAQTGSEAHPDSMD